MPYQIETRLVKVKGKWWNPKTWNKTQKEIHYIWDMDTTLKPEEVPLFVRDMLRGNPWYKLEGKKE